MALADKERIIQQRYVEISQNDVGKQIAHLEALRQDARNEIIGVYQ